MKKTISMQEFTDEFQSVRPDNFSYEGLQALYEYLVQYEEDAGEELELDVIAFCCEYSEYDSAYDAMYEYQPEDMPLMGEDGDDLTEIQEKEEKAAMQWLEGHTTVIDVPGKGVIIKNF